MSHHLGGEAAEAAEHSNKKVALLIAILALLLSFSEIGGKFAEKEMVAHNIEASNLWAFFQAKTIRRTTMQVAGEQLKAQLPAITDPATKAAIEKQIKVWTDTEKRYDSEPSTREGRKELAARATKAEKVRDVQKARNELFEGSSALLQISIVVASAMIITGIAALIWLSLGLGSFAIVIMGAALFRPELVMALLHH